MEGDIRSLNRPDVRWPTDSELGPPENRAAGDPAGQWAQVHLLARPPKLGALEKPALHSQPCGGSAHWIFPGCLMAAR